MIEIKQTKQRLSLTNHDELLEPIMKYIFNTNSVNIL